MNHLDVLAERIAELEDLAAAEGLRLPMPASVIALHESAGHVVDLRTGAVLHGGAHLRLWRVLPAAADEPDPDIDGDIDEDEPEILLLANCPYCGALAFILTVENGAAVYWCERCALEFTEGQP